MLLIGIIIGIIFLLALSIICYTIYITNKEKISVKIAAKVSLESIISSIADLDKNFDYIRKFDSDNAEIKNTANNFYRKGYQDGYIDAKNDVISKLKKGEFKDVLN